MSVKRGKILDEKSESWSKKKLQRTRNKYERENISALAERLWWFIALVKLIILVAGQLDDRKQRKREREKEERRREEKTLKNSSSISSWYAKRWWCWKVVQGGDVTIMIIIWFKDFPFSTCSQLILNHLHPENISIQIALFNFNCNLCN